MYLTLEFTPIALYLVSIKVSGNQNAKEEETARDHSNRNSIMTEMVDRMSMDLWRKEVNNYDKCDKWKTSI